MRRRQFFRALGGAAAAALPFAARSQQTIPLLGFLNVRTATDTVGLTASFRQALNEVGFVEGRNLAIEYRWAANQVDQLPALAAELVNRPVTVIAAFGTAATLAAKSATTDIPIVFLTGDDPIKTGIVASLNRPVGNITGVTFLQLAAKRLELLRSIVPTTDLIGVLVDSNSAESINQTADVLVAAHTLGQKLKVLRVGTLGDVEATVANLKQQGVGALLLGGSPNFLTWRDQINTLLARYKIPAIHSGRQFITAGGLISYGASISEAYRQAGLYVGRILRGAKPTDLPVVQPAKFELVINLKAAKSLGLELPPTLLVLATEVIE